MQALEVLLFAPLGSATVPLAAFRRVLRQRELHASSLREVHKSHRESKRHYRYSHPVRVIPVAVENLELVKKSSWVTPEPKLPPAPVSLGMTHIDCLEMNGMIPNVALQAA